MTVGDDATGTVEVVTNLENAMEVARKWIIHKLANVDPYNTKVNPPVALGEAIACIQ